MRDGDRRGLLGRCGGRHISAYHSDAPNFAHPSPLAGADHHRRGQDPVAKSWACRQQGAIHSCQGQRATGWGAGSRCFREWKVRARVAPRAFIPGGAQNPSRTLVFFFSCPVKGERKLQKGFFCRGTTPFRQRCPKNPLKKAKVPTPLFRFDVGACPEASNRSGADGCISSFCETLWFKVQRAT